MRVGDLVDYVPDNKGRFVFTDNPIRPFLVEPLVIREVYNDGATLRATSSAGQLIGPARKFRIHIEEE